MSGVVRGFLILAALNAALAVVLGAMGAHALRPRLAAELFAAYQTAVFYHIVHALGLVAVALTLAHVGANRGLQLAGGLMLVGIVLFSGSLYLLSAGGLRGIGWLTPFGGVAFILAWLIYAAAVWRLGRGPA